MLNSIKTFAIAGFMLAATSLSAQNVKKSGNKVQDLHLPKTSFTSDFNYAIALNMGQLNVTQNDLYKKDNKGGLQAAQDRMNSAGPTQYLSANNYTLVAADAGPNALVTIHYGKFEIVNKTLKDHKIPCKRQGAEVNAENIQSCPAFYYEVAYKLPVVIVVKDANGKVLVTEELQDASSTQTTTFGYDKSGLTGYLKKGKLDEAYKESTVEKQAVLRSLDRCEDAVQQLFFCHYTTLYFDLGTGKGSHDYSALDGAFKEAEAAFKKMNKDNDAAAFTASTENAIKVWTEEVKGLDMDNKKARISKKIGFRLNMNLVYTHYFRGEYDEAMEFAIAAQKVSKKLSNIAFGQESVDAIKMINAKKAEMKSQASGAVASGELKNADVIMMQTRVKANKAPHQFIFTEDTYAAGLADHTAFQEALAGQQAEVQAQQVEEYNAATAGANKYESQVMSSSTQGDILIVAPFVEKLEVFPAEICDLTSLNQLTVNGHTFTSLPDNIGQLNNLTVLKLANNKLTAIPSSIGDLSNLKTLNLKNNNITSLPETLGQCKNLKKLILTGNSVPQEDIDKIKKMLPKLKISM